MVRYRLIFRYIPRPTKLIVYIFANGLLISQQLHISNPDSAESDFDLSGQPALFLSWGIQRMWKLTGSYFEEAASEPSPHIGDSLGEIVRESLLFKGGQSVCNHMPDPGQISKMATHIDETCKTKIRRIHLWMYKQDTCVIPKHALTLLYEKV